MVTSPIHSGEQASGKWRRKTESFADDAATQISPDLVAAVVPSELLQQDEIVLILTKPSLWFILFTSFSFIVGTVLLGVLAARIASGYASVQTFALITVLICLGRLVWALLVWSSHIYMLTNLRLVTIKGVANVKMFQAPLRKIQRTVLYKPLILRFFGMGSIGIATAATETFDSTWVMISRPLATHEQIVAAINKAQ